MRYSLTRADFDTVFKFAISYHLDPSKSGSIRTSGASRGLGGVLDSFVRGKLVEIGVKEILKSINPQKDYILDFDIKKVNEVSKEPDILKISERGIGRAPNLFVEIKNTSASDRWAGLTEEQLQTSKKASGESRVYIIGASIENSQEGKTAKEKDFVGSYLREVTQGELFKRFADISNAEINVEYAFSAEDLEKNGKRFAKNSYLYETEVFTEVSRLVYGQAIGGKFRKSKNTNIDSLVPHKVSSLPPPDFGQFTISGKVDILQKTNPKSMRIYLVCHSNVQIKNEVLGIFNLLKNKIYLFNPGTLGRNPVLDRNNIWIAKRKISQLIESGDLPSASDSLKKIARTI